MDCNNATQKDYCKVKIKISLQPHFPSCSCCSITLCIFIIISNTRCTSFRCKVSAKFCPLCISCYVLFVFLCPISYFKCLLFSILYLSVMGLSYRIVPYMSNINLNYFVVLVIVVLLLLFFPL